MNELQLGLIVFGGVGVAGLYGYNKWQEHKHRKVAEQVLQRDHADVLLARRCPASELPDDEDDLPEMRGKTRVESGAADASSATNVSSASSARHGAPDAAAVPGRASEMPAVRLDQPDFRSIRERVEPEIRIEPSFAEERIEPVLTAEPAAPVLHAQVSVAAQAAPPVLTEAAADVPPWEAAEPATPVVSVTAPVAGITEAAAAPGAATRAAEANVPQVSETSAAVPAILVSPAIDYIASFDLIEAVTGDQVLRSQRELLSRVTKPVNWAGFNDRTREWERVVAEGMYRRLRIGLQLADRRGALGEADLLTFHGAMAALAEELMAVAEMPDHDAALNAAIALDRFSADVDIQIGLNLVSQGQTFPGTKIRALAEAAGLQLEAGGLFVRRDDDGLVLYTLHNQEATPFAADTMRTLTTHGLVFLMDVACVSHGDRVFAQMLDVARRMAETLHGVLVDDHRRPLTEAAMDPFRRQIGQYQAQLAAKGLPAGSPLTLRLFA